MTQKFYDLSQYTGIIQTATTFTITLESGFQDIEDNIETVVAIRDTNGNYAVVTGEKSGSTFTVNQLLSDSYPEFSGNVAIRSVIGADYLNRGNKIGAFICAGQSNVTGWGEPKVDEIDYVDGRVMQHRYESRDSSGTLYDTTLDGPVLAEDQLYAYQQNGLNSISLVPHAAKALVNYAGWNAIEIQDGSQGTTAFGPITSGLNQPGGQWVPTGTHAVRLKAMTTAFLNRNEYNVPAVMLIGLGESDTLEGNVTESQFATWLDEMIDDMRTTVGMDNLPVVVMTMSSRFLSQYPASGVINNAILDTPNRRSFTSVLDATGLTRRDDFHHDAPALRILGRDRFIGAYFAALANFALDTSADQLTGSTVGSGNIDASLAAPAQLTGNTTGTGTTSGNLLELNPSANLTGNTTGTGAVAGTLFEPVVLDALFLRGTGQGASDQWDDQTGNGNHATQLNAGQNPTFEAGGEVTFNGNQQFQLPTTLLDNTAEGFTAIFDLQTGVAGRVYLGSNNTFMNTNTPPSFVGMSTSNSFPATGAVINDNVRHEIAMTVDVVGDRMQVWIDGVEYVNETGLATAVTSTPMYLGAGFFSGPAFKYSGTIYNCAFKRGPLTKAQIDSVFANEFVA